MFGIDDKAIDELVNSKSAFSNEAAYTAAQKAGSNYIPWADYNNLWSQWNTRAPGTARMGYNAPNSQFTNNLSNLYSVSAPGYTTTGGAEDLTREFNPFQWSRYLTEAEAPGGWAQNIDPYTGQITGVGATHGTGGGMFGDLIQGPGKLALMALGANTLPGLVGGTQSVTTPAWGAEQALDAAVGGQALGATAAPAAAGAGALNAAAPAAAGAAGAGTTAAGAGGLGSTMSSLLSGGNATPLAIAGSSLLGYMGSQNAAKAQAEQAANSAALQKQMYDSNVALNAPFRQAGLDAQNRMLTLLGIKTGATGANLPGYGADTTSPDFGKYAKDFSMSDFQADPGYAFRLNEGLKALDRSAAARGGLLSGASLKAAQRYGQDAASQEYTNAFNRYQVNRQNQLNPLQSLAGVSQSTSQALGNAGQSMASAVGQDYQNAGAARASGYMGGANAISGGLGTYLNYTQNQNMLNLLRNQSPWNTSGGWTGEH